MADTFRDPMVRTLDVMTSSRSVLSAILTSEEARLVRCAKEMVALQNQRNLERIAERQKAGDRAWLTVKPADVQKRLYYWNQVRGLVQIGGPDQDGNLIAQDEPIPDISGPLGGGTSENLDNVFLHMRSRSGDGVPREDRERAVYILADVAGVLEPVTGSIAYRTVRVIRDLISEMKTKSVNILCVGARWPDIPELKEDVERVEMPLPDRDVVRQRVLINERAAARVPDWTVEMTDDDRELVVTALLGLSEQQIDRVLSRAVRSAGDRGQFTVGMVESIIEQKAQLIKAVGCLEYIQPMDVSEAGGYAPVLKLLRDASRSRKQRYERRHARLKGVIFTGVAGTGKGWWARISGGVRGVPTIRLDMGAAMGSLVGETEGNVSQALKIVESMGDCNLWIDEFEKAVGGMASSNQTDGGTTARAVGKLMTWMSEQEACFIIACANDISALDPALLRGGRFDKKLFFGLPPAPDLEAILTVHLQKRAIAPETVDVPRVALAMEARGFVAAEVEVVVKEAVLDCIGRYEDALEEAEDEGLVAESDFEPTTQDLLTQVDCYVPLAVMNKDVVDAQQQWAGEYGFVSACTGKPVEKRTGRRALPRVAVNLPPLSDDVNMGEES